MDLHLKIILKQINEIDRSVKDLHDKINKITDSIKFNNELIIDITDKRIKKSIKDRNGKITWNN